MSTNYFKISGCTSGSTEYIVTYGGTLPPYGSYVFSSGSVPDGCYELISDWPVSTPDGVVDLVREFDSCADCDADTPPIPVSAGTYDYTMCVICPDGSGGYTYTPTQVPHPIATNNQGYRDIIQLDAVVIGGVNGLNS